MPERTTVWRAKQKITAEELLPMLEVHDLGFELNVQKMVILAIKTFGLEDEVMLAFRFHFDGAACGVTVFGFTLLHPSVPTDSNYAFFPIAVWDGPENAFFLRRQAPLAVGFLEDYARDFTKHDGFVILDSTRQFQRVQVFLNPDMKP